MSECWQLDRETTWTHVLMAFAPAEAEDLGVVAHKGDAFGWVAWLRAEIARLDPHLGCGISLLLPGALLLLDALPSSTQRRRRKKDGF